MIYPIIYIVISFLLIMLISVLLGLNKIDDAYIYILLSFIWPLLMAIFIAMLPGLIPWGITKMIVYIIKYKKEKKYKKIESLAFLEKSYDNYMKEK